jgi:predicted transglutaminase-like cysteine proteinase
VSVRALFSGAALVAALSVPAGAAELMATGDITSQPIGHYDFCSAHPDECSIRSIDDGPEHMTGALWRVTVAVNAAVNATVQPMSDVDLYGQDEVWTYPDGAGDCEDYVLEKRRELHDHGVALSNLLITVARKPDGEGHAVLTMRTDKGDFVLDNLTDSVRQWNHTGYRYLKRQDTTDTGQWVAIVDVQAPTLVGALE